MASVHAFRPSSQPGDLRDLRTRFHTLLDAAFAFGAGVVLFAAEYSGDLRADLEAWHAAHAEETILVEDKHINSTAIRKGYADVCRVYWEAAED